MSNVAGETREYSFRSLGRGGHGATACTRFASVRPQYYPAALVVTTERPRTEQRMAPRRVVSAP
eukprot:4095837-Prymnesium_polylepis.1